MWTKMAKMCFWKMKTLSEGKENKTWEGKGRKRSWFKKEKIGGVCLTASCETRKATHVWQQEHEMRQWNHQQEWEAEGDEHQDRRERSERGSHTVAASWSNHDPPRAWSTPGSLTRLGTPAPARTPPGASQQPWPSTPGPPTRQAPASQSNNKRQFLL